MSSTRKGRPPTWPSRITAPEEALELYRTIAKVQGSSAFRDCHVYHGAAVGELPLIRFEGSVTSLPFVVASFIGLPTGRKRCNTPGCCNPFHYIHEIAAETVHIGHGASPDAVHDPKMEVGLDEWVDLVDYYIDANRVRREDIQFATLRKLVPIEDLADAQLQSALEAWLERTFPIDKE